MVIKQRPKKPKKEINWREKYLAEKAENKKLKKQLSTLRKMIGKSDTVSPSETSTTEEVNVDVWEYYCPNCEAQVDVIEAGNFKIFKCNKCKTKGHINE